MPTKESQSSDILAFHGGTPFGLYPTLPYVLNTLPIKLAAQAERSLLNPYPYEILNRGEVEWEDNLILYLYVTDENTGAQGG